MISGATRGAGTGGALAAHLLKAENERVTVIAARGLGGDGLAAQIRELVAMSMGGRTDRPAYHVHVDPDAGIADEAAARARWWELFEEEFALEAQPYCGVVHVKGGRTHEHRIYGLVRPDGSVIGLSWDYARREKVSRIVEREHGMAPVASKHARTIERRLRAEGMIETADWLRRSGAPSAARPIAPLTPTERQRQERTGVALDALRLEVLKAWRAGSDGPAFLAALRARGLDLRRGREGPVIVDAAGGAHLATRLIGAAARRFEGERILAASVRERLAGLQLEGVGHGRRDDRATARRDGTVAAPDRGDPRPGARPRCDGVGIRRPDRNAGRPDGGGGRRHGGPARAALGRLRALPAGRRLSLVRHLGALGPNLGAYHAAVERAREAVARMEAEAAYERERAWALWGMTDIWGIPLR